MTPEDVHFFFWLVLRLYNCVKEKNNEGIKVFIERLSATKCDKEAVSLCHLLSNLDNLILGHREQRIRSSALALKRTIIAQIKADASEPPHQVQNKLKVQRGKKRKRGDKSEVILSKMVKTEKMSHEVSKKRKREDDFEEFDFPERKKVKISCLSVTSLISEFLSLKL